VTEPPVIRQPSSQESLCPRPQAQLQSPSLQTPGDLNPDTGPILQPRSCPGSQAQNSSCVEACLLVQHNFHKLSKANCYPVTDCT
jgi:hypothetical protein